jgi:hypothetical protein
MIRSQRPPAKSPRAILLPAQSFAVATAELSVTTFCTFLRELSPPSLHCRGAPGDSVHRDSVGQMGNFSSHDPTQAGSQGSVGQHDACNASTYMCRQFLNFAVDFYVIRFQNYCRADLAAIVAAVRLWTWYSSTVRAAGHMALTKQPGAARDFRMQLSSKGTCVGS